MEEPLILKKPNFKLAEEIINKAVALKKQQL